MSPKDEIERLRKEMLVGSKRGNRFLEGFSKSAVILHSVTLPQLWQRLIEEDQKLRVTAGVPIPVVLEENDELIDKVIVVDDQEADDVDEAVPVEEEVAEDLSTIETLRSVQTASGLSSVKRLLRKANDGLEERGFNFLNLCIGKVHWKGRFER